MAKETCGAAVPCTVKAAQAAALERSHGDAKQQKSDVLYYLMTETYTKGDKQKTRKKAFKGCSKQISDNGLCIDHTRQASKGKTPVLRLQAMIDKGKIRCVNPPKVEKVIVCPKVQKTVPSVKQPLQVRTSLKSRVEMKEILDNAESENDADQSSSGSESESSSDSGSGSESESSSDSGSGSESESSSDSGSEEDSGTSANESETDNEPRAIKVKKKEPPKKQPAPKRGPIFKKKISRPPKKKVVPKCVRDYLRTACGGKPEQRCEKCDRHFCLNHWQEKDYAYFCKKYQIELCHLCKKEHFAENPDARPKVEPEVDSGDTSSSADSSSESEATESGSESESESGSESETTDSDNGSGSEEETESEEDDGDTTPAVLKMLDGKQHEEKMNQLIEKKMKALPSQLTDCVRIYVSKDCEVERSQPLLLHDKTGLVMMTHDKTQYQASEVKAYPIGVMMRVEHTKAPIIYDGAFYAVVRTWKHEGRYLQRCVLSRQLYYPNSENQWVYVGEYEHPRKGNPVTVNWADILV